ncbi:MAG: D-isomer specific 2-hydroxyacid dehydrogenase NAD-binding protein [Deltaproteobacteria bacterium]|nr:D-isomer specific 2-hydroxyacid dehydrogenase NAD-binding protein [Deltaproteobacteria bacterium]
MASDVVRVVLTTPLEESNLQKIRAVGARLKVDQLSPLILAERKGDLSKKGELDGLFGEAEVVYGWIHHFPKNLLSRSPRLKWIQTMSAGVDRLPEDIMKSPVRIANASGLHGTPMAEVVLQMMLMFAKDAPSCFQMKAKKEFKRYTPMLLKGQTAGVLGLGAVGKEIARLCQACGMAVLGIRRSSREGEAYSNVDRVYSREQLSQFLAASDFVIIAMPLTRETKGMIGEKELRSMKPTAYLINVARGAIVDEAALIRALEEKWIAGAGLDVFVDEPLPPESRFYELPKVIFSPHISGEMPDYERRATEVFCENLQRYLQGEPFRHEVDKLKGY